MPNHRTIKEYRDERDRYSKQNFLTLHPSPVLLMPNPASAPKPVSMVNSGFLTFAQPGPNAPNAAPARKAPLVVTDDFLVLPVAKVEGRPFPDRIGVGRTKSTDVQLEDRDVSKFHGYFSVSGEKWSFTDAGSSNGTFVRGVRLVQNVTTPIDDGAEIGFGAGRYVFRTAPGFCDFLLRP